MSLIDRLKYLGRRIARSLGADAVVIPVVRLEGMIAPGGRGAGSSISLSRVERLIERAFSMKDAPAVAILVNSPGGSPVQSKLIHDRIRALAAEEERPVLAFCEDLAASGGYMIACAGDEIICDDASILGSIGVVSASFGFTGAMEKLGVERRLMTAGENKALMDPFSPLEEGQKQRMEAMIEAVHQVFIDLVKSRRGDKLADDPDLFTGALYIGGSAVEAGLADAVGEMRAEVLKRYGKKAKLKMLTPSRPGPAGWLFGSAAHAVADALESRALWSRSGL